MKKILFPVFVLLVLIGCKTIEEDNEQFDPQEEWRENEVQADAHNSRNSLDWEGTYTGVLKCEDCPGIETIINLNKNFSYILEQRKIETLDEEGTEFQNSGRITWNENGSVITVEGMDGELQLKVEELYLVPVDDNGHELKAEPGNNFKLLKQ